MQFKRMFSTDAYKGTSGYLRTQKNYEILRTVLYFAISLSLFIAGRVTTGSRENLLTIVAVLGCLPACKSLVEMFMFLRYKGCNEQDAAQIAAHTDGLTGLYDMVFTSYEKNYVIHHMTIRCYLRQCLHQRGDLYPDRSGLWLADDHFPGLV